MTRNTLRVALGLALAWVGAQPARAVTLVHSRRLRRRKIKFDHGTVTERPNDLDDNFYRLSVVAVF